MRRKSFVVSCISTNLRIRLGCRHEPSFRISLCIGLGIWAPFVYVRLIIGQQGTVAIFKSATLSYTKGEEELLLSTHQRILEKDEVTPFGLVHYRNVLKTLPRLFFVIERQFKKQKLMQPHFCW